MEKLRSNLKIILFSVLGLILVASLFFAGYNLGQRQVQPRIIEGPTPTPQVMPSPRREREVKISTEDNDGQVMLEIGQTLVLNLGSNPTTGYGWEIAEIDETVLKQMHHEYKSDRPILLGSGGQDIWHFRAEAAGRTSLTLNYRRPWEEVKPTQTFSVEVEVVVRLEEEEISGYQIFGGFTREASGNEIKLFQETISQYSTSVIIMASFPGKFKITAPDKDSCEEIRKILPRFKFISSFGECRQRETPLRPEEPVSPEE